MALAVWAGSPENVWAVGMDGWVGRWNGHTFQTLPTHARFLVAVWGTSPSDVWMAGDQSLLHWDGAKLAELPVGNGRLTAIWGSGSADVWLVGALGSLHWDGRALAPVPELAKERLVTVAGSGPNDVWAAGDSGATAHFDGHAWTVDRVAGKDPWTALRVLGPGDVWEAGPKHALRHFDGTRWSAWAAPAQVYRLEGAWAFTENDERWRWDGKAWTQARDVAAHHVAALAGSGADLWVLGAPALYFDGKTWARLGSAALQAVASRSPTEAWGTSQSGLYRWDGTLWLEVARDAELWSLWAAAPGEVWGGTRDGRVARWDGKELREEPTPSELAIVSLWGSSQKDVWASDTVRALHFDGSAWSEVSVGRRLGERLGAFAGTANDDVWLVSEGELGHFDGKAWSWWRPGDDARLTALWPRARGDAWAVGARGTVYHYDGHTWKPEPSGVTDDLTAVWGVGDRVFVGTAHGLLVHDLEVKR
jgi:hypothetical protein